MLDSEHSHERFITLLTEYEGVIRASIRSVIQRPEDVAEVMQAVSLTMWRKFDSLTDSSGFAKWACVIARYEILKFKREKARDRFQLDDTLIALILDESAHEMPAHAARMQHLEACLQRLPEPRRALVLQAYAPGCSMKALAERLGKSQDGLYQLMRRIREELRQCVESQLARDGGVLPTNLL
jgi:RNA polymerase sigma-70 factor (ECF subfamily)